MKGQTKMAQVVVTIRIMPSDPDVSLADIKGQACALIQKFGGEVGKSEEQAVAFGLKALNIIFVMDENKGSTEPLEKQISEIEGVNSAEVTDVRRAVG